MNAPHNLASVIAAATAAADPVCAACGAGPDNCACVVRCDNCRALVWADEAVRYNGAQRVGCLDCVAAGCLRGLL